MQNNVQLVFKIQKFQPVWSGVYQPKSGSRKATHQPDKAKTEDLRVSLGNLRGGNCG